MNSFKKNKSSFLEKASRHYTGDHLIKLWGTFQSPFRLLIIIILSVFSCELLVMFVIPLLPIPSILLHALSDSILLVILISPLLYLFVFRPLFLHIGERKQAEEALQESEERYRLIVENQIDLVVKFDTDWQLLFVSPSYCETLGKTEEELLGKEFMTFIHEDDRESISRSLKKVFLSPYTANHEGRVYTKTDERWFAWHVKGVLNESGQIDSIIAAGHDITERKRLDDLYRNLFLEAPFSYQSLDDDGKFIEANNAWLKMMGYSRDEVVGKWFGSFLDDESDAQQLFATNFPCFKELGETVVEFEMIKKDGEKATINFDGRIGYNSDGSFRQTHCILHDITEQKRTEEERKKLKLQLQQAQKMESIGTLAGGIAHDFNNILSPIMMHSEMAMMELPPDSPTQHNLEEICKSAERAADLVTQVLTFSRKGEGKRMAIKIIPILKDVLKMLRSSIPTTIDIQHNLTAESDAVFAEPTQIHQIILNLATNATHAMRETGGILKVSLVQEDLDRETAEQYSGLNPGSYLKLSMKDNGSGMDDEMIQKIFEPYFTTKELGEGTGMGLAIVHGIVKSYDGDITVESELEKGTTFNVYLPRIEKDASSVEKPLAELSRGTERILFVDDEKIFVDIIQPMLEKLGYEVTARTNSLEALEAFRNNPEGFDLVITDMAMPNMTGKDLATEMMTIRPDIPIILCTGFSDQIDEYKAKEMGINVFLMKPIMIRQIANTIRELLDKK